MKQMALFTYIRSMPDEIWYKMRKMVEHNNLNDIEKQFNVTGYKENVIVRAEYDKIP